MADDLFRGNCPYGDCERIILFHEDVQPNQPGVCYDCYRKYRVKTIDKPNKRVTLKPD